MTQIQAKIRTYQAYLSYLDLPVGDAVLHNHHLVITNVPRPKGLAIDQRLGCLQYVQQLAYCPGTLQEYQSSSQRELNDHLAKRGMSWPALYQ